MVSLIQLPALEESLEHHDERPQLRILLLQVLDQFHTVDAVRPVKRDVQVNSRALVHYLDQRHTCVLQRLNTAADA